MSACGVSVVVPVYRNAGTLVELHRRLDRALSTERNLHFVFVDDACPDGSAAVLDRLAEIDPRVRVVRHDSNAGQHRAVLSGLRVARGAWAVIMDADLQDPPEAVPLLLRCGREEGAEVVFGTRRGRYEGLGRTVSGRLYRRALARMLDLPHGAGTFCALDEAVVRRVTSSVAPSRPSWR